MACYLPLRSVAFARASTSQEVQAFWLAVDVDQSGSVSAGEFGKMMRIGEKWRKAEAVAAQKAAQKEAQLRAARGEEVKVKRKKAPPPPKLTLSEAERAARLAEAIELADISRQTALEEVRLKRERMDKESEKIESMLGAGAARAGHKSRASETLGQSLSLPVIATAKNESASISKPTAPRMGAGGSLPQLS